MNVQFHFPQAVGYIIDTLNDAGFEAYVVGGCVRDALRGNEPHDWDIATSALPEQTKACFSGERVIETGIRHGTVGILLEDEIYEVTTYRIDGEYKDNRHPQEVEFVDRIELDLARRDFTVNAMAYHPKKELVDPFSGESDLKNGILRCVGVPQERFSEDALRIMRAIRFASVLGFSIEEHTADAIHALKESLNHIAMERIRTELVKLLCGKNVREVLTEYADVIFTVIPELKALKGYYQNTPYHNKDIWEHTVLATANIEAEPLLRLTMLLHDAAKPFCYTETYEYPYVDSDEMLTIGHFKGHPAKSAVIAQEVLKRLRCDRKTIDMVSKLIYWHDERPAAERVTVKKLMSKIGAEDFLLLQKVRKADTKAQRPAFCDKTVKQIGQVEALAQKLILENTCLTAAQLELTGADLIAAGIPQGKRIGEILNKLLDAVVAEELPNDRAALLNAAKRYQ